jgi:ribosomal protein L3 glutamine methyltransferase
LTVGGLIDEVTRRLRAAKLCYGHGTANARDEAAFLVLRGLGLPFDAILDSAVNARQLQRIENLTTQRIRERVPTAYLLGEAWLDGRSFHVDRRVIVPRSHIPFVLKRLKLAPRSVLDLCTGSGCLAILAAYAFPRTLVDAVDLSASALRVAQINVARHRLRRRVRLVRSDLFAALRGRRYDLIITNPPYVGAAAMRKLPPEYLHEPQLALAGGRDGLALVSRIIVEARAHLSAGGLLVCEVGDRRKALERAHPRAPLRWPQDEVFILERREKVG